MNHPIGFDNTKVVHGAAIAVDCLGTYSCAARPNILPPKFWHQPLQRFQESSFAERTADLRQASSVILGRHSPEAAVTDHFHEIAGPEAQSRVTLATES